MTKNCLIILKNKKLFNLSPDHDIISQFGGEGVYFSTVFAVAYDDSEEIASAFKSSVNYVNTVIYFPESMDGAVRKYAEELYSGQFDEVGVLRSQNNNVFLLHDSGNNKLTVTDAVNLINEALGVSYGKSYIKTVGAPPSDINEALAQAKTLCPDCDFNVSETFGDCKIEIVYPSTLSKSLFDNILRGLVAKLDNYIYALEDISLAQRLYQLLKLRRMKISVAESFTGGGIAKRLVEVSGISEVYIEGLNTYANQSKMSRLGVKEMTLDKFGAVSEETAYEMAEGLLSTGMCDVAVATTGIAGPKSDQTNKPVGLVYISVGTSDGIKVYKYELNGGRENITERSINSALFLAYKTIK